jgi:ketosteroid isomerase-like protein
MVKATKGTFCGEVTCGLTGRFCQTRIGAMKATLITLATVLGLAATGFGAGAEVELKALEQQWLEAYVKGDAAFVKTVEADTWTFVDSDGKVVSKAQDLKELGDKTFVCKSAAMSDASVKMLGDNAAYVTGVVKMSGTYKGKDFNETVRVIDVYEKKDGKWQSTYSQSTKISEGKE